VFLTRADFPNAETAIVSYEKQGFPVCISGEESEPIAEWRLDDRGFNFAGG
jgi:hypothetical protein